MTITKAAIKFVLRRYLVVILLAANVGAFALTSTIFNSSYTFENGEKKGLISKMYTGWQIVDWSFSLIDYLSDITDRK